MSLIGPDLTTLEPLIKGYRSERQLQPNRFLDKLARYLSGRLSLSGRAGHSFAATRFVKQVNAYADELAAMDNQSLQEKLSELRFNLRSKGLVSRWVALSFALIREVADRELNQRHFDTQIIGGWLLLRGFIAEMPTGEGKTLTATLAAGTAAIAGLSVHVLTVNDYLTSRDAHEMGPVYKTLGLSLGVIIHGVDNDERRRLYAKDVVYCTSKEIVFDYLRDRIVQGPRHQPLRQKIEPLFGSAGHQKRLLTQGLHFAIVDEADSVLIDEARTPLIISSPEGSKYEKQFLQQSLEIATELIEDTDYQLIVSERRVRLLPEGIEQIRHLSRDLGALWSGQIRREEVVSQALTALYLFHLDKQYLIRDDKIEIIDPLTGRVAEGRSWERGLHQLIELKEGVAMSQQQSTLAKISYQSFFQRYLHLSGMTGTAREVAGELWQVYKLPVAAVAPHKPCIRQTLPTRLLPDNSSKWQFIAERTRELINEGRAVLIGTASVADSEKAAGHFQQLGLQFSLLNAKQDQAEAEIVARAGEPATITIATSMAGRGTDIKLEDSVRQQGGLHVILTEHFDAARVDRQLAGRCARQGDPGSFEAILSPQDASSNNRLAGWFAGAGLVLGLQAGPGKMLGLLAFKWEQKNRERKTYKERSATRKYDQQQDELLSISGGGE